MARFGAASGWRRSHAPSSEGRAVGSMEQTQRPHAGAQALTPDPRVGRRDTRKVSAETSEQRGCWRGWGREARSEQQATVAWLQVGKPRRASGTRRLATVGCATDSQVEQGLEVGSVSQPMTARGQRPAETHGTAAWEGKALEGGASEGTSRTARAAEDRNPVNPMVGSRMQQACERIGGANRRGGENPRGRNMSDAWQRRAEAHREVCGSGHQAGCRRRGDL